MSLPDPLATFVPCRIVPCITWSVERPHPCGSHDEFAWQQGTVARASGMACSLRVGLMPRALVAAVAVVFAVLTAVPVHVAAAPEPVISCTEHAQNPSRDNQIAYTVTFSESVTGLDANDFVVEGNGLSVVDTTLSGSGTSYTLTVSLQEGQVMHTCPGTFTKSAGYAEVWCMRTVPEAIWLSARASCQGHQDADLASIHSTEEQNFALSVAAYTPVWYVLKPCARVGCGCVRGRRLCSRWPRGRAGLVHPMSVPPRSQASGPGQMEVTTPTLRAFCLASLTL